MKTIPESLVIQSSYHVQLLYNHILLLILYDISQGEPLNFLHTAGSTDLHPKNVRRLPAKR